MDKQENKTLNISVCETFEVNHIIDKKINVPEKVESLFEVFVWSFITRMQSINILSRPPTFRFNLLIKQGNHLAI